MPNDQEWRSPTNRPSMDQPMPAARHAWTPGAFGSPDLISNVPPPPPPVKAIDLIGRGSLTDKNDGR